MLPIPIKEAPFGVGYGTAMVYRCRVTVALRDLASDYIKWSDEEGRKAIALAIQSKFDFPHCVWIAGSRQ